jgi:hypothetical protein
MLGLVFIALYTQSDCGMPSGIWFYLPEYSAYILTQHGSLRLAYRSFFADPNRFEWLPIPPADNRTDALEPIQIRTRKPLVIFPQEISCNSYLGGTGVTVLDEEMHHRTKLDPSLVARNVRERDVEFLLMYHEFFSALASFSFIEAKSFVACYRKSGEPLPTMSAERSFLLINETWASATFGPSKITLCGRKRLLTFTLPSTTRSRAI